MVENPENNVTKNESVILPYNLTCSDNYIPNAVQFFNSKYLITIKLY